ncbi:hypothetical protein C1645_758200 [Glomus cerebriforme]|uniref:MARVEL domain-containing protein n=1 Tax=Glomus cerebriforme TaxID=658196 RepID=A0A397TCP1_9GLOM|nr:hypothetical protein C1645_758200 [Glomus cerebriforme]
MRLDRYPTLFRMLRFLTIIVTVTIIALEIVEYKTYSLFTQSSAITIEDYQIIKSNLYGPFVRDIVFGIGFTILWIVAGLTNIYAYYYAPEVTCPGYSTSNLQLFSLRSEIPWELRLKCKSYLSITGLAWLNVVIFLLSTMLYWKLWADKRNNSIFMEYL